MSDQPTTWSEKTKKLAANTHAYGQAPFSPQGYRAFIHFRSELHVSMKLDEEKPFTLPIHKTEDHESNTRTDPEN